MSTASITLSKSPSATIHTSPFTFTATYGKFGCSAIARFAGIVHGVVHPLGIRYHQPHGLLCGVMLPLALINLFLTGALASLDVLVICPAVRDQITAGLTAFVNIFDGLAHP